MRINLSKGGMLEYAGRYKDKMGTLCIEHDIVVFICAARTHKV